MQSRISKSSVNSSLLSNPASHDNFTTSVKNVIKQYPRTIDQFSHPKVRDEVVSVFISAMMKDIVKSWEVEPVTVNLVEDVPNKTEETTEERRSVTGEKPRAFSKKMSQPQPRNLRMSPSAQSKKLSEKDLPITESDINTKLRALIEPDLKNDKDSSTTSQIKLEDWKFNESDYIANIVFKNGNRYVGRISRSVMHGSGEYYWPNGTIYKGTFDCGAITGRGIIQWQSLAWYHGDVYHGYRHGYGLLVIPQLLTFIGNWIQGVRHGEGVLLYKHKSHKQDLYDVRWVNGKCEGNGLRVYPSGAQYRGQWKYGIQDGYGTMIWPNGDIYIGDWVIGKMEGVGKYVWKAIMNNEFIVPARNSYFGTWVKSTRHGVGILETTIDVIVRGKWVNNLKDGYGEIICRNGIKVEGDPLFFNDNLVDMKFSKSHPWNFMVKTDNYNILKFDFTFIEVRKKTSPQVKPNLDKAKAVDQDDSSKLSEKVDIESDYYSKHKYFNPTMLPSEYIDLSYYIIRLTKSKPIMNQIKVFNSRQNRTKMFEELEKNPKIFMNSTCDYFRKYKDFDLKNPYLFYQFESKCVRNIITSHLPYLKKLYTIYASMLSSEEPNFRILLPRLLLWQMFRDCVILKSGINLSGLDVFVKNNPASMIEDERNPFEKLRFYQFLHYLVELSWQLYGRFLLGDIKIPGVLGSALEKLIEDDLKPNARFHYGIALFQYFDLLPLHDLYYNVYCKQELFNIRSLLMMVLNVQQMPYLAYAIDRVSETVKPGPTGIFSKMDSYCKEDLSTTNLNTEQITSSTTTAVLAQWESYNYRNVYGIGDLPIYKAMSLKNVCKESIGVPQELKERRDSIFNQSNPNTKKQSIGNEVDLRGSEGTEDVSDKYSLSNIDVLTAISCIQNICPNVRVNGQLTNFDYKITFLEFYEILLSFAIKSIEKDYKLKLPQRKVVIANDEVEKIEKPKVPVTPAKVSEKQKRRSGPKK